MTQKTITCQYNVNTDAYQITVDKTLFNCDGCADIDFIESFVTHLGYKFEQLEDISWDDEDEWEDEDEE